MIIRYRQQHRINHNGQMSESLLVGGMMAISGGFMDAYTYIFRDKVFANAQTGNIILCGIHLSEKDWAGAFRYFCPVFAFALGVFIAQLLRLHFVNRPKLHWRQITVLIEAIILLAVAFIDTRFNLIANSLVSLACGIQVQAFRKIKGNNLATTMCIGNLRSATDLLCNYLHSKDKRLLQKSLLYYGIIGTFALGAVLGYIGIAVFGMRAILASCVIMIVVFFMMLQEEKE